MSIIDLLGYGVLWLLAAFIFGIVFGRAMSEVWEDEDYDPEFAHFVEPITEAAKQERLAESLLYPRTKLNVEDVVPLTYRLTPDSVRKLEALMDERRQG